MAAMFGSDITAGSGLPLERCRSIDETHSLSDTVSCTNPGIEGSRPHQPQRDPGCDQPRAVARRCHEEMAALNTKYTSNRNSIYK